MMNVLFGTSRESGPILGAGKIETVLSRFGQTTRYFNVEHFTCSDL